MEKVTLYSKPGCHLCEDARDLLLRIQTTQPFELEEVNIQDDPALLAEYGEQIPVVHIGKQILFADAVSETRLQEALKEVN